MSSGKRQRTRTTPLQAAIQILGFAGTSHLLHFAIELFPFYETSRLADVPPLFRDGDPWALAGALLQFALIPAILEELIFRGALFALFERLRGPRFAIGLSAVLFGMAHFDAHHVAVATLLGVQLGLLRHVFGLPLAIGAHLLNNVFALLASFLHQTSDHGLPDFEAGPLSLLIALAFASSAWAVLMQRMRSSETEVDPGAGGLQTPERKDE